MTSSSPADRAATAICRYRWTYPLVNFDTGEVKTCCHTLGHTVEQQELDAKGTDVFLNGDDQIERRKEMLEGVRHESCVYCWKMEDNGVRSPRHGPESFTEYFNRFGQPGGFAELIDRFRGDPSILRSSKPLLLEIILGNTCDLKCMYCNFVFSSSWEQELRRNAEIAPWRTLPTAPRGFEEKFWLWFRETCPSLEYISFIGGEPTLIPKFYEMLDRLFAIYEENAKDKRPTIGIISNFNANERHFERFILLLPRLVTRFKVLLLASVDTTGPQAEYIRNGLKWERFERNVRRVLELRLPNLDFTINPTINAFSVTTMIRLLKLAKSMQDEYDFPVALGRNMVVTPGYFSPLVLTPDFASHIDECAEYVRSNIDPRYPIGYHGDWNMYVDFLTGIAAAIRNAKPDLAERRRCFVATRKSDERRKTDFLSVFPEYREFMKGCSEDLVKEGNP